MDRLPESINKIVEGLLYKKDDLGRSDDEVINYSNKYILKISKDKAALLNEKNKTDWIASHINGPKSIAYEEKEDKAYYLRECINGDNLLSQRFITNPLLLIETLKEVIKQLRVLDEYDCPFRSNASSGNKFIHGDLCLPNIYVDSSNHFIGFIDVAESGIGDIDYDYLWLLWSFEYNVKTDKYRDIFLKELDINLDNDKFRKYVLNELSSSIIKKAYLAGGCFWCIASVFDNLIGVSNVTSGYSGGDEINPSYEQVKKQLTHHRECIEINYDENIISYEKLVSVFLDSVDPYDGDGQFIDKGHSYTLAVYYQNEKEKEIASKMIDDLAKKSNKEVKIAIEPFTSFYKAEEVHQNYHKKNPEAFNKELIESGRKKSI